MKKLMLIALITTLAGCASKQSGDEVHFFQIADALNSPLATDVLDPTIKLHFASKGSAKIIQSGLVSNRKTNAVSRTSEEACQRAFLSAVKQFQSTAAEKNATQVVNLISFYKKEPYSSTTQYECRVGTIMAGVALQGDLAR